MDSIYRELKDIEKDVEMGLDGGGYVTVEMEEYRRHMDLIIDQCREISSTTQHDVRKIFEKVGNTLSDQCVKIRKHEIRINRESIGQIEQLNGLTQMKKTLATELRAVIDAVKRLDFENKEVCNGLAAAENAYEAKMADATG